MIYGLAWIGPNNVMNFRREVFDSVSLARWYSLLIMRVERRHYYFVQGLEPVGSHGVTRLLFQVTK